MGVFCGTCVFVYEFKRQRQRRYMYIGVLATVATLTVSRRINASGLIHHLIN